MKSLSTHAARFKPLVFTLVALLMLLGGYNYFTLPAQEDPKITIREAVITTHFPGMSAEKVELLITKPIELAIRQVPELEEVRSTSRPGTSIIHAKTYDHLFELEQIWDDLRQKVRQAESQLPDGTQTPQINDDFGDVAVVTAALTGDDFSAGEIRHYAQHIRDQLYSVTGTKKVQLHGIQPERVYIETSQVKLNEVGYTRAQFIQILRSQNVLSAGGEVELPSGSLLIDPSGQFNTLDDMRNLLLPAPQGGTIALRDLAQVRIGPVEPASRKVFFNGQRAVIFAVSMLEGQRVLEYAPRLKNKLEEIESSLPIGLNLDIVTYQAEQVGNAVFGVTQSVLQTLVIVLVVVVIFLGVRTGLIVGTIVPGVMLITLAVMGFADIPLERMSLATLVIALGLLVDNGIVIAEDYKRRLEEGVSRDDALNQCGRELCLPLLASTLTTILVFIPLMMAQHPAGEYTRSISLVILISLLTSWLLAMTVTPVLCRYFMTMPTPSSKTPEKGAFHRLELRYASLLRAVLAHKAVFLVSILVLFGLGVAGIIIAPKQFFPGSDRAQVLITLNLPAGSNLNQTSTTLKQLFPVLSDDDAFEYIDDYAAYAGYGGPRFVLSLTPLDPATNKAFVVANLNSYDAMPQAIKELRSMFKRQFPGVNASVRGMFLGPSDPNIVHLQVKGPDKSVVYEYGQKLASEVKQIPGMIDVWHDWENPISRLYISVNQQQARRAGVSSADITEALTHYYSGGVISQFVQGDELLPIAIRGEPEERRQLSKLYSLNVNSKGGHSVPLMQVADVQVHPAAGAIQREDMTRTLTVEGRPLYRSPEDMAPRLQSIMDRLSEDLPPGHYMEFDGIITDSAAGKAALSANMPLSFGVILLLLVAQFNSFKRPLMIVATIPLLVSGAALGLTVMGSSFGFMEILGLLSLAGIIINNALVLIDRIDIERASGHDMDEAIITAASRRLRPIIMTTVTTVFGLMPLIIAVDALFYGMASVIAFGLVIGTLLTLGVTPVLYQLMAPRGVDN
ncbi:Nickel-cobalt-cadmium resistance protein NccA [Saliniradius amylolyticus]|uniref:Nickel-cobalt-cadmium resistance protein NccA n=1 Tax=Saliniradius amylolyticus TaxID=2183582 RepID=A0A2S2E7D8_9ALTE|nr:efflux RND transporter permease subunit [Saliniradius amylolyticus]AWL13140.1 Nickel-cobalt-cadmium resistance protein NccA [Saliniradius amylolyticus]